jgi:hypothetical protein
MANLIAIISHILLQLVINAVIVKRNTKIILLWFREKGKKERKREREREKERERERERERKRERERVLNINFLGLKKQLFY